MRSESRAGSWPAQSRRLGARVREMRELGSNMEDAIDEIGEFMRVQAQTRPYASLASAAAFGYVLGGGIPTPVISLAFGLGSRAAVSLLLRELIAPVFRQSSGRRA
jgi:hypothetical protein